MEGRQPLGHGGVDEGVGDRSAVQEEPGEDGAVEQRELVVALTWVPEVSSSLLKSARRSSPMRVSARALSGSWSACAATARAAVRTAGTLTPERRLFNQAVLSVDDLADQLVAAADAEGLDRFAVSGYSLGGAVAIRIAARYPERVTALVLTAAFAHRDNRLALASSVWNKIAASGDGELLAEFMLLMALGTQGLQSMPGEQLRQVLGYTAAAAVEGSPEQADLVGRVDVRDDLAAIDVPALVISTTDDRLTSTALHRHLAHTISGAELAEIVTGHVPMLERADDWLRLITDFLGKYDA
jgi:pimeloyl-ACP methyl ester carboxylesterase